MADFLLNKPQSQIVQLPWAYPNISQHFFVAGYGAGKSTADVMICNELANRYWKHPVTVGVGSSTISLLQKTVISSWEKFLVESWSKYKYNKASNVVQVGKMQFVMVATNRPELIYGHNFSAFLDDELDELEATKAVEANKAITERTRVPFPDGRPPFVVHSTTSQGFKGTYQIIEESKKTGEAYTLVRGRTMDNIANLDRKYVKRLFNVYTENERRAYLEGEFVNLQSGRVYPEFDASTMMKPPMKHGDDDVAYVGQDMNTGYSKAVGVKILDGIIYFTKEFSFENFGRAPQLLRKAFPTQEIQWYPDASTRGVIDQMLEEVDSYDIDYYPSTVNPSIADRIFVLNKLFAMGRAFVCEGCDELKMALQTRQFDDKGNPEKPNGPKDPSHIMDATEYVVWNVVTALEEFEDLYSLTRTYQRKSRGLARRE